MAEEIDVENGRNSNFEGLMTLTLTFDPAIPHTVVHHSSTCTYIPNFMEMGRKKFSKVNTEIDVEVQSHVTQKLGQISKIRPDQIYILCPSLRISGHLPAPVVNGRGDRF